MVYNNLTHGNIIGTYVLIHYHDNVHVQFNDVYVYNDQNDVFIKEPINVNSLEVYNPKRCLFITIESLYNINNININNCHTFCCVFSFFFIF